MIGSPEINKVIRNLFSPILKQHGFSKVQTRKNWTWQKHTIWALEIRAVGKYFSDVTGWTPSSIGINLGVFYDFIPYSDKLIKSEGDKLLPLVEDDCHIRTSLYHCLDQTLYTAHMQNPAERNRKDLWWIASDGTNVEEAVQNMTDTFLNRALPWFEYFSDLENAYSSVLSYRDCPAKYYLAEQFAKYLNDEPNYNKFSKLLLENPIRYSGIPRVGLHVVDFWDKQLH